MTFHISKLSINVYLWGLYWRWNGGYGWSIAKATPPLFSERNGCRKVFRFAGIMVQRLKPLDAHKGHP